VGGSTQAENDGLGIHHYFAYVQYGGLSRTSIPSHQKIILSTQQEVAMRLYVGNLNKEVTNEDLQAAFQAFGKVDEVTIVKDRSNNVSKGFAFVDMPDKTEAEAAIKGLHRQPMKGQSMDVNEARPKTDRPKGGGFRGGDSGRKGGGGRRW
jgi:RNA recognition motif-containing protein